MNTLKDFKKDDEVTVSLPETFVVIGENDGKVEVEDEMSGRHFFWPEHLDHI